MDGSQKRSSSAKEKTTQILKKLQAVHTERFNKKNHLELEFLNKIRNYCKQRSQLELEYGLAVQRLSQQCQTDEQHCQEMGYSNRSLYAVWNSYLDDSAKIGKQHQSLSHFYAQNMGENLKSLHSGKLEAARRCLDHMNKIHNELQLSARDMEKHKRDYVTAQSIIEESRTKLDALQEKLQKRSPGLFHSMDQVEKDAEKLRTRMNEVEVQACNARNFYLIQLEALKAHQDRYRSTDLPALVQEQEEGLLEQVWTYLSAVVAIEKENYATIEKAVSTLAKEVEHVLTPEEHHKAFLDSDRSLKYPIQIAFEPCGRDPQTSIIVNSYTEADLIREARKWIGSVMRHQKAIDDIRPKLNQLKQLELHAWEARKNATSTADSPSQSGMQELARKIDELQDSIRKEQTAKTKAESIVEYMRKSGVNMEEASTLVANLSIPESASMSSHLSEWSLNGCSDDNNSEGEPVQMEQEGKKYKVLFDYQAIRPDEMSLRFGEELTLFDDPAEVQWPRGRNVSGQTGLVPSNYVERLPEAIVIIKKKPLPPTPKSAPAPPTGAKPKFSIFVDDHDSPQKPTLITVTNGHTDLDDEEDGVGWCIAELDYAADSADELSFCTGDLIRISSFQPSGVDDGWWSGHIFPSGHNGTFPSLMVRELTDAEAKQKQRKLQRPAVPPGKGRPLSTIY